MTKLKLVNRATAVSVGLVAAFAAIISYTHIYCLAIAHGTHRLDAILTPLSIDGPILAASLVLLYVAMQKLEVPLLARVTLWISIGMTIIANVVFGLPAGTIPGWLVTVVLASWPAVALILTVETVMQLAKAKRVRATKIARFDEDTPYNRVKTKRNYDRMKNGPVTVLPDTTGDLVPKPLKDELVSNQQPYNPRPVAVTKVPTILEIRDYLKPCGQPRATQVQRIIRKEGCNIDTADRLRKEVKQNA